MAICAQERRRLLRFARNDITGAYSASEMQLARVTSMRFLAVLAMTSKTEFYRLYHCEEPFDIAPHSLRSGATQGKLRGEAISYLMIGKGVHGDVCPANLRAGAAPVFGNSVS